MSSDQPLLEMRGISKAFPGVQALADVDLTLGRGEVLAVVGENGAGKSTLMKIAAGAHTADRGEVLLEGRPVTITTVADAVRLGICLIHQELNLCDNLDVAANVFLGREPVAGGPLALLGKRRIHEASREWLERVGLDCSPGDIVGRLPTGRQQLVEIAKALSQDARILIMDEPTSSLTQREADLLFGVIRELSERGVSVVYISHRLGEVGEVADRVLVLRDGRNAGELRGDEIEHDRMVRLMIGRDIEQFYHRSSAEPGPVALEVADLRTCDHPRFGVSFSIRSGEIVGVAGLVGAGRTEVARAIFGVDPPLAGSIRVAGQSVTIKHPRDAIRAGIALVPEDRKQQGLIVEMAVRENITLAGLGKWQHWQLIQRRAERRAAEEAVKRFAIRTPSAEQIVNNLSGGNQQKTVLAKWLAVRPRVMLLDEPTRGVDVGSKAEIYRLLAELAQEGTAILMISSELEEVIGMSDRALVMYEGRLTGELRRDELTEEAIMQLATGRDVAA